MDRAYVYLLRCEDNTLYTGMTTHPHARFSTHRQQLAACAKYTKSHPVSEVAALFCCRNKSDALKLEARIKRLTHAEKETLIRGEGVFEELMELFLYRCDQSPAVRYDRILGSLLGGAAGDALGYEVEFESHQSIVFRYGKQGIATLPNAAVLSDDTQMTLFTLAALLQTKREGKTTPTALRTALLRGYFDWFTTQGEGDAPPYTSLLTEPFLFVRRAPGMTCLDALRQQYRETQNGTKPVVRYSCEQRINNSKGCGGVMRTAPIGFSSETWMPMTAAELGAEAAALTHGHPMGWLSAALLSEMVSCLIGGLSLETAFSLSAETVRSLYRDVPHTEPFLNFMFHAVSLAASERKDVDVIHELGGGWVGEQALAIALFCAFRYPMDIRAALIAAANHDGDSDSTAAILGNLLGARLGAETVKEQLKPMQVTRLEGMALIERLAREATELL